MLKPNNIRTLKVSSVETLGALDGAGLRTVIFLSGCPMRCLYCHNPETWTGGEERDIDELVAFCERYKNYYGKTGGVTLSGGEPLAQESGVLLAIEKFHGKGIHVAVDTGGSVFSPKIIDAVDLVILDIKHTDENEFRALTGVGMENLLKTLAYIKQIKKPFWVRQVIAPTITDSDENIIKLAEMSEGAERIELLPYHTMGVEKYEKLGYEYKLGGIAPPTKELMEKLEKRVKEIQNTKKI